MTPEKLHRSKEQFGKINDTFTLTLLVICLVEGNELLVVAIARIDISGPKPLLLGAVDKRLELSGREFLVVPVQNLEQALDRR